VSLVWLQEPKIGGFRVYSLNRRTDAGLTRVGMVMQEPDGGWNTGYCVEGFRQHNDGWYIFDTFEHAGEYICAEIECRARDRMKVE